MDKKNEILAIGVGLLLLASGVFGYVAGRYRNAVDDRLQREKNQFMNIMAFDLAATKDMTLVHGQWILTTLYELSPKHHAQHLANLEKQGLTYSEYRSNRNAAADSTWDAIEENEAASRATKEQLEEYMEENTLIIARLNKWATLFNFLQILFTVLAVPLYLYTLQSLLPKKRVPEES